MLQAEQILHERYQLKRKLGQNAGRQTWLAEDIGVSPSESVIVKLLAFGGDVQWEDLKLFEREAQILKQLNHPQIPQYRDYFSIDDRSLWFGLVQQHIPGVSLKEHLTQGKRFTAEEISKIAIDVLNILDFLHQLNPAVLHRDIKPSNLIWGEDDCIYLVDFGAVQHRAVTEGTTFTVVGTYGYTPMEQFGARAVPASDLYALGATLIHLLTGTAPADLPQRNLRICFEDQVNLDPRVVNWIKKLTEPAPEQRFESASQAFYALEAALMPPVREEIQRVEPISPNNSGQGNFLDTSVPVPREIQGWNWGAFLLPWLWPFTNQVWIGLFSYVPICRVVIALALGAKGNEWAWKSRKWRSIEQFKAHQRRWTLAGICIWLLIGLSIVVTI
jgi:serine/threonine protein kinase